MVRKKNVLATVMQCFAITCLVTVLWVDLRLLASPSHGDGNYIGNLARFDLQGLAADGLNAAASLGANAIPESVFMMFQMTFAIITPALIVGAFADRMKFSALLLFMALWLLLVYCADRALGLGRRLPGAGMGVLDFAGGTVVHINAGIAGLVCALVLGKRVGYGTREHGAAQPALSVIGASLLWVGWFGFNAGSARRGRTAAPAWRWL